jgi:hypothetical protein
MAGLLDAKQGQPQMMAQEQPMPEDPDQAAPAQAQPGGDLQDPILKQIEKGIEAAVPKELKSAYLRIITSGMKIMFSKETSKFMDERLEKSGDIVQAVSEGIADMLVLIYNESKRTMSIPAAMLAAFTLMAQALDFAEKTGKAEVTPELIDQCTEATWQAVTAKFGISKEQVDQVIAQSQGGQGEQPQEPQAAPQGGLLQQPMMEA